VLAREPLRTWSIAFGLSALIHGSLIGILSEQSWDMPESRRPRLISQLVELVEPVRPRAREEPRPTPPPPLPKPPPPAPRVAPKPLPRPLETKPSPEPPPPEVVRRSGPAPDTPPAPPVPLAKTPPPAPPPAQAPPASPASQVRTPPPAPAPPAPTPTAPRPLAAEPPPASPAPTRAPAPALLEGRRDTGPEADLVIPAGRKSAPGHTAARTSSGRSPGVASLPRSDGGSAASGAPSGTASGSSTGGITRWAHPRGGYQVRPHYPASARRLGIQGTARLKVHVLADGRVGEIIVESSAGHDDLDRAATEAVRQWRFEPARRGTEAVATWVLLPVKFQLR
jgi:protein TonB